MWYMYLLANQEMQMEQNEASIINYCVPSEIISSGSFCQKPFYSQSSYFNIPTMPVLNDEIKSAFKPFNLAENNSETLPFTETAESNEKQCAEFLPKQKSIKKEKKVSSKKMKQIIEQKDEISKNAGRNSTSNIFRVFIKLCSKPKFESILKLKFQEVAAYHSFYISFEYFKLRVKELAPSTSNYINVKEFKKSCDGDSEFSKAFRILFHWFLNNYAINHSLTLKGKHRMMKESIGCFLNNLHSIEGELWEKKNECVFSENATF